ncbi:hypothetical protein PICMEDRAFT_15767 [Pichia membranifaciens NRRL Y-2026]|uniref:ATP synthase subunit n=1 Tax=Pichia membranifaciens NRRL Y-2026 TaxID=763406 RepID=A0A1E3NP88_9ASCO|nr:hypothetical protein PICMEDRAFT_15767 [Pichia membranifaciens NRRL Y-2026]ODQ47892.1 hypothetical protein PICMEDRAFT_15767 [Pichia membranifaciens NRRL Y-2026]
MFARQSIRAVAAASKAQPVARRSASSLAQTIASFSEKSVYYTKVALELSKSVYVKEGLAPPTVAEVTKVYECALKQADSFAKDPKAFADLVAKNAQGFSKDEILRYICYFIQIVGFFSLGEIVGRRNVVGYAEH